MIEKSAQAQGKRKPEIRGVVHRVVLWNLLPGVTEEQVDLMNTKGQEMLKQVPGVVDLYFGVTMEADAPYRYYALLTLSSPEMVEVFNRHPLHAEFGELYFNHIIADPHYVVDYVIQS